VGRTVDRVIMLYPLSRLGNDESQIVFDGSPAEVFSAHDQRVFQFVHGQAGERLQELALQ
jgi:phospholipid/cholesterol/gamma-HCH transport system ATP-binding protein